MTPQTTRLPITVLAFLLSRAAASFGSAVTFFALDVWTYQITGSYAVFAGIATLTALPTLLLSPLAGALVDRYPGKKPLIWCDALSGLAVLSLFGAFLADALSVLHVGGVAVVLASLRTVAWPASWANLTRLTPSEHRARVNGLAEAFEGSTMVLAPMLGALLMRAAGMSAVFLLDAVVGVLSLLALICIRIDVVAKTNLATGLGNVWRELLRDSAFGFRWILQRRELLKLLMFFMVVNLCSSVYTVAYTPYILSFATPNILAICVGLGGAGIVAGGLLFGWLGGMRRHDRGVLVGAAVSGLCMLAAGTIRSPVGLFVAAFAFGLSIPLTNASSQTIWQARTPEDVLGRVFSIRRMIAWSLNPFSILVSIPLAEVVFAPMLRWRLGEQDMSSIWGAGEPGRLGLMIAACGALCTTAAVWTLLADGLRLDDDEPKPASALNSAST